MPHFSLPRTVRLTRTHKISAALVASASCAAALAMTAAPSNAATPAAHASALVKPVGADGLPIAAKDKAAKEQNQDEAATASVAAGLQVTAVAKQGHVAQQVASRSAERAPIAKEAPKAAPKAAPKTYANNLDGWIRQSLDIMKSKGIPGSYDGLHRNIMRESSGNPYAINDWDINARNGIPSKGLLQVIQPTFDTYHVAGTAHSLYDPVANITAAANYAAHRYGSIDNVNSAY
ncbi:transglycosylase SLT domain-containing protein [Streptomyces sp. MspMP-M5]|uniref:transglycosylase SLT domain-containing protein n=1 Tax=Streptomyces sp. SID8354 TaxID=2690339 RepID=UPI0004779FA0|nr:transglycosylase SLT domain-containing protein [Streptomyces sp. MspMP-M5]